MSFPHEAIAAFPTGGQPDPALIRSMCERRFAYCLATGELASNFVAKDPVSGVPPLNLIQGGTLFAYDETDSTTAPSDVCLVTSDACRYKSGSVELPDSVLTYSTIAQPADVDVSDGDRFLLPIGATGADWAGKAGQIAIRKGARWYFAISPIGRRLYVEDEDAFYYRNDSGVWTAGNGSIALAANSVPINAVIGAKASFVVKVENQTTNAPPASPVAPVAYIIGPSPTGAWAGRAGDVAMCLVDGAFTIITPATGDEVYDKALGINVKFNGSAWISAAGAIVGLALERASGIFAPPTGTGVAGYNYSATVAPTTVQYHVFESLTIAYRAKRAGAWLRVKYNAFVTYFNPGTVNRTIALHYDSVTAAVDWQRVYTVDALMLQPELWIQTPDAELHTYVVAFYQTVAGDISSASRRTMTVEEFA